MLAGQMQNGPARDEQLQLGRRREQPAEQRRGLRQLLEVVEDEHRWLAAQVVGERFLDGPPARADAERVGDRRGDQSGVEEMREIDENCAAPLVRRQSTGHLRREPRLPDPAGPGQRQQARAPGLQQVRRLGQLPLAPQERRRGGRELEPALSGARHGEALVLHEDRPLERL